MFCKAPLKAATRALCSPAVRQATSGRPRAFLKFVRLGYRPILHRSFKALKLTNSSPSCIGMASTSFGGLWSSGLCSGGLWSGGLWSGGREQRYFWIVIVIWNLSKKFLQSILLWRRGHTVRCQSRIRGWHGLFSASRGPSPFVDGPGHPRIIHLRQNRLPCIAKTAS